MRTLPLTLLALGCATHEHSDGIDSDPRETDVADSDTGEPAAVPTGAAALLPWLTEGSYAGWPAESAPHASTGPHFGRVRTFFNPSLDSSLRAAATSHPSGAATVKELFGDGDTVRGWSVMVKVREGTSAADWYWYETFGAQTYADGEGVGLCSGCHGGGSDFILTRWP